MPVVSEGRNEPRLSSWGPVALGFVFLAVGLELLAAQYSNSPVPDAARWLVPLAWPQAVRVLWWTLVTLAAAGFRYAEYRAGIRRHPLIVIGSTVPFAVFSIGIAFGASFSTWH